MWLSLIQGVGTGAGLIIAIGAQNAFVLSKGLRRQHVWWVAGICALCDAVLIGLGVMGLGALIAQSEGAMLLARYGGAAFLAWQAWLAIGRVRRPRGMDVASSASSASLAQVVLATLAVTLLNPQVYLDTLVMLGAIGSLQESPVGFYVGATIAVIAFLGRSCQETAQPVPQAPPGPRQGVGLVPAPDATPAPDPLLSPAGPRRQPDDDA